MLNTIMSFKPLKDLLDDNTSLPNNKSRLNTKSPFLALVRHWDKIVGEKLALKTKPLKLKADTLIILTEHSSFSHHLKLMEKDIIKKIHSLLPQLSDQLRTTYYYVNHKFFQEKKSDLKDQIIVENKPDKQKKLHPYSPEYLSLKKKAQEVLVDNDEFSEDLISLFIQLNRDKN